MTNHFRKNLDSEELRYFAMYSFIRGFKPLAVVVQLKGALRTIVRLSF